MLTVAFATRLQPYGVKVNACHPGDVNSRLSNDLGFGGQTTPDKGADTPVWLATDPGSSMKRANTSSSGVRYAAGLSRMLLRGSAL
jgi:NAD(P)-dependent dehydrogenase (short-subunit alcohol dehydrogenase family)